MTTNSPEVQAAGTSEAFTTGALGLARLVGDIGPSDRIGRIGVMYVRALLAQAGIRNEETSPGEDYGAVDLAVHLQGAPVTVQVKTSQRSRTPREAYRVPVTAAWRDKWAEQRIPVYLVFVALAKAAAPELVDHYAASTRFHVHAYWVQVNNVQANAVRVPVHNRLCLDTFGAWNEHLEQLFSKGAA